MAEDWWSARLAGRVARTAARFAAEPGVPEHLRLAGLSLAEAKLPWYEIRAAAIGEDDAGDVAEPDTAEVLIYDEIGGSFGVSAKQFAADLQEITAPKISVRINSPGGSVFDALAIHSSLLHHPATVRVFVDGIAASAASVVAMAADPYDEDRDAGGIMVMPGGEMMIHDVSSVVDGNPAEMAKVVTFLERQSDNLAALYARRAGGDPADWRELMRAETWMYGAEAVELGLADRVWSQSAEPDPLLARRHDLTRYQYRYASRAAAPAPRRMRGVGLPVRMPYEVGKIDPAEGTGKMDRASGASFDAPAERVRAEVRERAGAGGPGYAPPPSADLRAAAQARGEAAERRAHQLAQGGRRVPVLSTSPAYRTQLRVVRSELPASLGAARIQGFASQVRRAGTVAKGGRQLEHLAGYASMYRRPYEMWDDYGPYEEEVAQRAGAASLAAGPDVAFLVNHLGVTMARTTTGTLLLAEDDDGLADDAFVNPDRADVQLLLSAVDDELVTEQSFAFMIDEGRWSEDYTRYTIIRYNIHRGDVSAVNYGANPYTSVAARGQELMRTLSQLPSGLARAAFEQLARRRDLAELRYLGTSEGRREQRATPAPSQRDGAGQPTGRKISTIEAIYGL